MFSRHVLKEISAYCNGELSAAQSRDFAAHIMLCSKCRARYEEIKLGVSLAEQLPRLHAPDELWADLEPLIDAQQTLTPVERKSWATPRMKVAIAAAVLIVVTVGIWFLLRPSTLLPSPKSSWQVARINGTPRIESSAVTDKAQLSVGQWLETDGISRAQIAENSVGQVEVDPNTKLRLVGINGNEHRFELARGKMSAHIWAPPRLFFVDTPSAVAADLGCSYTLQVDDSGGSLLRVTSGWVALQLKDRESMVPAGAACQTRKGVGPGTPYFEDASPEFRQALTSFDFENGRKASIDSLLSHARKRDTLTLWHVLSRVDGDERLHVYQKMASFVPPPSGVTPEGVLRLDQKMLDAWRDELESTWSEGNLIPKKVAEEFWRIKNGVNRRVNQLQ
ncbi:MAG: hypothetical protein C5B55_01330 [Blastocatellia bacterium]|nr:MAG: hypothetical protein C5B55_01330 [Blastocatellia bacterium]